MELGIRGDVKDLEVKATSELKGAVLAERVNSTFLEREIKSIVARDLPEKGFVVKKLVPRVKSEKSVMAKVKMK